MTTIKEITHDSSTTLSDFYGTITDVDGAVTVTSASALGGSTNGLSIDYDAGSNLAQVEDTFSSTTPSTARGRARVNLDGLTNNNTSSDQAAEVLFAEPGGAGGDTLIGLKVNGDGATGFEVRFFGFADGANIDIGNFALPSGDVCLEMAITRESSDGANDGTAEGFINGVSQGTQSNVENFNHFQFGQAVVFVSTNDTDFTGTCKLDEFILTNNSGDSLCPFSGFDLVLGGGQP